MKLYVKAGVVKPGNRIVIRTEGYQVINPSEDMLLAEGWKEYVAPEPTIDEVRAMKRQEIMDYDSSSAVNEFTMQGVSMWIDKATRTGLMLRFQAEQAMGLSTTTLWYEGRQFVLNIPDAIGVLYAIERYASECYDNTQSHLAVLSNLESAEAIEAYDYRSGYPQKLVISGNEM